MFQWLNSGVSNLLTTYLLIVLAFDYNIWYTHMGTKCHTHMLTAGIVSYTGPCYIFVYFALDAGDSVPTKRARTRSR